MAIDAIISSPPELANYSVTITAWQMQAIKIAVFGSCDTGAVAASIADPGSPLSRANAYIVLLAPTVNPTEALIFSIAVAMPKIVVAGTEDVQS